MCVCVYIAYIHTRIHDVVLYPSIDTGHEPIHRLDPPPTKEFSEPREYNRGRLLGSAAHPSPGTGCALARSGTSRLRPASIRSTRKVATASEEIYERTCRDFLEISSGTGAEAFLPGLSFFFESPRQSVEFLF